MKINSEKLWDYIFNLATDEKVKFKVYYDDCYLTEIYWDGENFNWEAGRFTSGAFFNPLYDFEIIEEEKDIEKIEIYDSYTNHQNLHTYINTYDDKDGKEKKFVVGAVQRETIMKLNEIIDELNKLKGGKND